MGVSLHWSLIRNWQGAKMEFYRYRLSSYTYLIEGLLGQGELTEYR